MTTFAVSMMKNEIDIAPYTVEHTLSQVDHMIVADNLSSDGTREELDRLSNVYDNLTVVYDDDPAYNQSEKTTRLVDMAHRMGATHILIVDADEYWQANDGGRIADMFLKFPRHTLFPAKMMNFYPTGLDLEEKSPFDRIQWRSRELNALDKVAFLGGRGTVVDMGAHSISRRKGFRERPMQNMLSVRHYPYRSPEQFIQKVVQGGIALDLTDLAPEQGAHWREYYNLYKREGPKVLEDVFYRFFHFSDTSGLVHDPVKA